MLVDTPLRGIDTRPMPKGFLTVTEAAARRGLKAQQVRDAIKNGNLAAEKSGPIWLIRIEDIDAFEIKSAGRPKAKRGRPPKTRN